MSQDRPHPLGLTEREFVAAYAGVRGGAASAYRALFRTGSAPGLPGFERPPISRTLRSESPEGEVVKFLMSVRGKAEAADGAAGEGGGLPVLTPRQARGLATLETESVLIPIVARQRVHSHTLCVSSQVGCAMGCAFCETAQMGLVRSLEPWEIVAQWHAATHGLGVRPRGVVFMGMGEPMDNLPNVLKAIEVLTDHAGAAVPMSRIVVSTVGRLDGIAALAERVHRPGWHRLNLAVSVNAPSDEVRSRIMPINRAAPMAELRRALAAWPVYGQAKICLEYVLIPGVNDQPGHAQELADWARGLPAAVQVIPYNPRRESPWPAPREEDVAAFIARVVEAGVPCMRRRTKGRDMMGACGQLGSAAIRRTPPASLRST